MPRPAHFEIHAADMDRAAKFYTSAFGWTFKKWDGPFDYMVVYTGIPGAKPEEQKETGVDGGMVLRKGPAPAADAPVSAFVCTMEVDNFETYEKKILDAGGTVALPKMPIGGVGFLGYFKDTEGNIFGIIQNATDAK